MEELEQNAIDLLKEKEFEKAAKIYLQLAMTHAEDERFLVSAANCYDRFGDKKLALSLYKKALLVNACSIPALVNTATLFYEVKKYDKTIEYAQKALELDAHNFSALLDMGNAYYADGKYFEALQYYEKVVAINPNSYTAILNIANACYNLGRFLQAIEYAEMAIEKRPMSPEGYIIAGNSFVDLAHNDEAANYLKQAAQIAPDSDWVCSSLANLFQRMGNWKQCLHFAWKVFTLKGNQVTLDDHINFAYFLYEVSEDTNYNEHTQLLDKYLDLWEKAYPDNPVVHHACCAIKNIQEVPQMDATYVKGLFDGFASSFDDILRQLNYAVPDLIANEVKTNLKTKLFKKRRILDLGCGTGLCAEALKKYFPNEEFYGVDLSERMLDEAGRKNIYKELYADDITHFLANTQEVYHTVVAGDVLTYCGTLKAIFRELAHVVKFNGFWVFSVSKNVFNNDDYFLTPSGRFVHSLAYVQRLLKYCGFKTLHVTEATLRYEGARQVEGYVVTAQKELEVIFE